MTSGSEKRIRKPFSIRLSDDERAIIDAKAERAGLEIGSYARETLLDAPAPRQVRRPLVERKELSRLLGELGKIGSNLNQLTKSANAGITLYENEVRGILASLATVRDAILKALGREP